MASTPSTEPGRVRIIAYTITWVTLMGAALALLVLIVAQMQPQKALSHHQIRHRYRRPLPNVENTESHPQPAWVLDRG